MDKFFKRLHDRKVPVGLEWSILKLLPKVLIAGTLLTLSLSLLVRLLPGAEPGIDAAKRILTVDIFVFATILTFWTAILTVCIGCIVVYVMKGPAYVADAYPLEDARRPSQENDR
jgi:hypothetical protein